MLWQDRRRKHRVIATPSRNISIMHYNLTSSGSNTSYQAPTNNGSTNVSYSSNLGHDLSGSSLQYGDSALLNTNDNIAGMWKQSQLYQPYPMNSYLSNYPKQQQLYYAPQTYDYRPISQMQWFNRVPTNYQYYYSMTYPKSQSNNICSTASSIQQPYSTSSTATSPLQMQQLLLTPTYTSYPVYPYNTAAAMYNALAGTSSLTTTKKSKKKRKRKNRKKGKENKAPKSDDSLFLHTSMVTLASTDEETSADPDFSMSATPSIDEEIGLISQEVQDTDFKLDQCLQDANSDIFKMNMEILIDKQDQELQDIFNEFQRDNHINDQIFQDCQQHYDEDQVFNQSCQEEDDKDQELIRNNFRYESDIFQNVELDSNLSDKETDSLIDSKIDNQLKQAASKLLLHLNPMFANEEKDFDDAASDCGSEDIDFVIQRHTPVELNYRVSPSESLAAEIELATEKAKRRQGIVFDDDYDCIPLNDEDGLCDEIEELMGNEKRKGGTRIILAVSKKRNVMSYRELQANEDHLIEQIEQEMDMKQSDSGVQSEESGDENDDVKISKSNKIKNITEDEEDEIWNIEKCNLKLDSMKRTEKSPLLKNLDGPIMPGCGLCCVVM